MFDFDLNKAAKNYDPMEQLRAAVANAENVKQQKERMEIVRDCCWRVVQSAKDGNAGVLMLDRWIELNQAISLASIAQTLLEMKIQKGGN